MNVQGRLYAMIPKGAWKNTTLRQVNLTRSQLQIKLRHVPITPLFYPPPVIYELDF